MAERSSSAGSRARDGEDRFWAGAAEATRFFMGNSDVHATLGRIANLLERDNVAYAIVGAMALNEYGYRRVTDDVDVLITREGLAALEANWIDRGYVDVFPGSRAIRDAETGVRIDFVLAGDYPGDGKPKPVAFPDPADVAVRSRSVSLVPLAKLVELKLASGMSAPHRLKDLADVLELVRVSGLPRSLSDDLDTSVRAKYLELWDAAQGADPG